MQFQMLNRFISCNYVSIFKLLRENNELFNIYRKWPYNKNNDFFHNYAISCIKNVMDYNAMNYNVRLTIRISIDIAI